MKRSRPRDLPAPLLRPPVAIAHRGGALLDVNLGKENSVEAFANSVELGFDYLETDLRTTRDGEVFAFHDAYLTRVVGETVKFADLTAEEIRDLRLAGGARIASLDDLLAEFPDTVFNIDFKDDAGVSRGLERIAHRDAADRVVIASFSHKRLQRVRNEAPHLFTTASYTEVARMKFQVRRRGVTAPIALQIPEGIRGVRLVTEGLIRRAHDHGIQVHVWTVDDPEVMRRLLDLGVDGIITDRPDVLREVLIERGEWPSPA